MSILIGWDNPERTALRQMFEGRWTWSEYEAATGALMRMIKNSNRIVDIVLDVRTMVTLDADDNWRAPNFCIHELPTNTGLVVVVDNGTGLAETVSLLYKLYRVDNPKVEKAASLSAAREMVACGVKRRTNRWVLAKVTSRTTQMAPVVAG